MTETGRGTKIGHYLLLFRFTARKNTHDTGVLVKGQTDSKKKWIVTDMTAKAWNHMIQLSWLRSGLSPTAASAEKMKARRAAGWPPPPHPPLHPRYSHKQSSRPSSAQHRVGLGRQRSLDVNTGLTTPTLSSASLPVFFSALHKCNQDQVYLKKSIDWHVSVQFDVSWSRIQGWNQELKHQKCPDKGTDPWYHFRRSYSLSIISLLSYIGLHLLFPFGQIRSIPLHRWEVHPSGEIASSISLKQPHTPLFLPLSVTLSLTRRVFVSSLFS